MTDTKYTPGPWVAKEYDNASDEFCIENHLSGEYVCSIDCDGAFDLNTGPRITANARLIASAPELLAALIEVREDCIARASPSGVTPIGRSAWRQLNDAISKSESKA